MEYRELFATIRQHVHHVCVQSPRDFWVEIQEIVGVKKPSAPAGSPPDSLVIGFRVLAAITCPIAIFAVGIFNNDALTPGQKWLQILLPIALSIRLGQLDLDTMQKEASPRLGSMRFGAGIAFTIAGMTFASMTSDADYEYAADVTAWFNQTFSETWQKVLMWLLFWFVILVGLVIAWLAQAVAYAFAYALSGIAALIVSYLCFVMLEYASRYSRYTVRWLMLYPVAVSIAEGTFPRSQILQTVLEVLNVRNSSLEVAGLLLTLAVVVASSQPHEPTNLQLD